MTTLGATPSTTTFPATAADVGAQVADADIPTVSASQAEMEAGTEAALRSMSPLRIKQAIDEHAAGGTDDQTAAEVPFTPVGTIAATDTQAAVAEVATDAASALTTHAGAADPHTGYQLESGLAAAITATKLDDLATPDDNTDLNATTGVHGLLPKLGGGSTNFLRADGTWNAPAGGGGGLVLVQTQTASASATLDFTTSISATYDQYLIEIDHLIPASNGVTLYLRYSTDGGSTYIATVYQWNHHLTYGAGTTADEGSTSDVGILFGNSVASAGAGVWGTVRLSKPGEAGTTYKTANLDTTRGHTSVGLVHDIGIGYLSVAAINAFRFLFSSGNIASGTVRVYGIAKA